MQRPGVDRLAQGPPTGAALRPRPLTPEPPLQALRPLPLGTLSCTPCLRCSWGGEPSPWALRWGSGHRHPSSCPTQGRFTIAAKHHISIAEIYETELVDIEKAIAHYEQSADYYKGEESNSSANKCLLKVAGYAAQLEQYQKAIDIYEQVGTPGRRALLSVEGTEHPVPFPSATLLSPRPVLSVAKPFLHPRPHAA